MSNATQRKLVTAFANSYANMKHCFVLSLRILNCTSQTRSNRSSVSPASKVQQVKPLIWASQSKAIYTLSLYLSIYPIYISNLYLPAYLPTYLPTYLPIYLSVYISFYICVFYNNNNNNNNNYYYYYY